MAEQTQVVVVPVHLTARPGNHKQRPGIKRLHHTWHGHTRPLTHFEDFMLEIGVDPRTVHLCCVPREGLTPSRQPHRPKRTNPQSSENVAHDRYPTLKDLVSRLESKQPPPIAQSSRSNHRSEAAPKASVSSKHPTVERRPKQRPQSGSHPLISAPVEHLKTRPMSATNLEAHSASFAASLRTSAAHDLLRSVARVFLIPHHETTSPDSPWTSDSEERDGETTPPSPPTPPTSTVSTTSLASRSRTSSFASLTTASSSSGPETPLAHSPPPLSSHELHRTLSALERSSKFRVQACCVTCRRPGSNYPCCPKCGDMWCSRHCRMAGGKDGKQACQCRTVDQPLVYV